MIPTNTNVSIEVKSKAPADSQAVVVFAAEGGKLSGDAAMLLTEAEMAAAMRLLSKSVVHGKPREIDFDLLDTDARGNVRRVYVAGIGDSEKLTPEVVRVAAGTVMKAIRKHKLTSVVVIPPVVAHGREAFGAGCTVVGLMLAAFEFTEYKGTLRKKDACAPVKVTILSTPEALDALKASIEPALIACEGQNFARSIASRPGNDITPVTLAKVATDLAKEVGLKSRVLDEKEMKKLGMGGILAVGSAGSAPPRLISLEYVPKSLPKGKKKTGPLLVVGKAITFDSGGISIKPADKMQYMVFDKCGAMAVLGLMYVVAKMKLPIHVVGILSSAENLLSEKAYRPGDILKMYNGVTVEITNTDAEGRLVLGDALAWGVETYKPSAIVNLATLTGGCVVALGNTIAGAFSNNDVLFDEIKIASERQGEKLWRLPLDDDFRDMLKSTPADIINSAGRWGSACTAAAFLSYFVPPSTDVPWVHLDIAGVADTEKELPYYAKGATGWGVRTLAQWVYNRSGLNPAAPASFAKEVAR